MTTSQLLKKIIPVPWSIQSFNGLPLYLICAAGPTGWLIKKVLGARYSHFFFSFRDGRGEMYYDERDLERVGRAYFKKFKTVAELRRLEALYHAQYSSTAFANLRPAVLHKLTDRQLVELLQKLRTRMVMSVGMGHAIEGISHVSEKMLQETAARKGHLTAADLHLLSAPVSPSFLSRAQEALWRIKKAVGPEKSRLTAAFRRNFFWIENTYVAGIELSEKDILRRAAHQKKPASPAGLRQTKHKKRQLMQKLKFSPAEKFVVDTVEICTAWQDQRKANILRTIGLFEPVICELARRLSVQPAVLKFALPEEIGPKLLHPSFISKLKTRHPAAAFYSTPKGSEIFSGADFVCLQEGLARDHAETKILKGLPASKGRATGTVRVCLSPADIRAFKKGCVLVAPMTRPEYLPAMQKAAAIVTDEGGITSHAAIVSRELGIPCIIGTKVATKILKNGGRVEVNADEGLVTIF